MRITIISTGALAAAVWASTNGVAKSKRVKNNNKLHNSNRRWLKPRRRQLKSLGVAF